LNWQLVGVYALSAPVGVRAVCNYGSEAFLTTFDDHVPLKQQPSVAGLRRTAGAREDIAICRRRGSRQPERVRLAGDVLQERPSADLQRAEPDGTFAQHVQNTSIKYRTRDGSDRIAMVPIFEYERILLGNSSTRTCISAARAGTVLCRRYRQHDLLGPVNAVGQQAWNTFQNPYRKHATAIRPVLSTIGALGYTFSIGSITATSIFRSRSSPQIRARPGIRRPGIRRRGRRNRCVDAVERLGRFGCGAVGRTEHRRDAAGDMVAHGFHGGERQTASSADLPRETRSPNGLATGWEWKSPSRTHRSGWLIAARSSRLRSSTITGRECRNHVCHDVIALGVPNAVRTILRIRSSN